MEIFKLVAQKVCHAICHMNYPIVKHQASMVNEMAFKLKTVDDKIYTVTFFDNEIWIERKRKRIAASFKWTVCSTCDELADEIVKITQSFHRDQKVG